MEKQLDSDCRGGIFQVPQHHWRVFLAEIIDAFEGRDIMVKYVPNTFIQTNIPPKKYGEERVTMKIKFVLVDMLVKQDS